MDQAPCGVRGWEARAGRVYDPGRWPPAVWPGLLFLLQKLFTFPVPSRLGRPVAWTSPACGPRDNTTPPRGKHLLLNRGRPEARAREVGAQA